MQRVQIAIWACDQTLTLCLGQTNELSELSEPRLRVRASDYRWCPNIDSFLYSQRVNKKWLCVHQIVLVYRSGQSAVNKTVPSRPSKPTGEEAEKLSAGYMPT